MEVFLILLVIALIIFIVWKVKKDNELKDSYQSCSVCNREFKDILSKNKYIIKDGVMCHDCYFKAKISSLEADPGTEKFPMYKTKTAETIRNAITPENLNRYAEERKISAEEALIPKCPKCGSKSLHAGTKKLSIGRALIGNKLAGGVGAILGGQSSKKVIITCLNCGHSWKPGKRK